MGVVKEDWSSRAIRNRDIMGILRKTNNKRKQCMQKGNYSLRVKALLRRAEIISLTEILYQQSEPELCKPPTSSPQSEPEQSYYIPAIHHKQPEPEEEDVFGLDKLFEDMNNSYKSNK